MPPPCLRLTGPPFVLLILLMAACGSEAPSSAAPSATAAQPSASPAETPEPTPSPSPMPTPEVDVPLAVITGYTNPRATITLDEVVGGNPLVPCTMTRANVEVTGDGDCAEAEEIVSTVIEQPERIALVPPGWVVPTVKVLPVDGADLFGNDEARSREYPITGTIAGTVDPYDAGQIRTLISLGDSCPDRGVAFAAVTQGLGWEWVFGGGTADYTAVYPNPVPPGFVGNGFNIVDAVRTGNEGAVAALVSGADVTLDDFECPVVDDWTVNDGTIFSIDPRVLGHLRDDYGVDVASLAANHLFDRGLGGFLQTLEKFEAEGIPVTGAGIDLDAALEPALVERGGLTFAFVGFNQIVGSTAAAPDVPGVAWLDEANIREAAMRADAGGDIVICVPQWWGGDTPGPGAEYHATFRGDMREHQAQMFDAGCDHILGHGTHWSGPIEVAEADGEYRATVVSHGNFLFGQEWSQQTQEGVIVELAFRGTELAQARMHPYIMLEQAQTNLTDPATDGLWVLNRIYEASDLPVLASP
jgi:poly-gamma-glutamate capsule biosynthesis protein CapA/YwtB (metallophosphatase superfamily)